MKTCPTLREQLALKATKVVGIAADHGGHELKDYLVTMLREAGAEVIDFGDHQLVPEDDYPDFVIPLARAVAAGQVSRGIAICGSGVGACVAANKIDGVRACLIHDPFSAHQGVEDDDLNLICLGGLVVGQALAWELVRTFLVARFSGEERHRRRLGKVIALEDPDSRNPVHNPDKNAPLPEVADNPDAPLRIHFIRHGETEWTFTRQHTGCTDLPLTAQGEDEVREWGKRLCGIPFHHVLTSPLQRAHRTCDLVGLGKQAELEPDLVEWDYGDYEGKRSVDIRKERPDWNVFRDGCPNGESTEEISDRADRLIARLRTMTGNIALFSHGQFGGVLAARWIGLSILEAQHFPLGTASLSILATNPHNPGVSVIDLWNSSPHEASRLAPLPSDADHMGRKPPSIQRWENEGGEIPTEPPEDQSGKASP
jgi:RpiB/LacA/LacB family sugar-phosphate isomerase